MERTPGFETLLPSKEQQIFDLFYPAEFLQVDHSSSTEEVFFFPTLYENMIRTSRSRLWASRQAQIANAYTLFDGTEVEAAMRHYRRLHNERYIERITTMAGRIPRRFLTDPKPTIVIAAMNEMETHRAVEAAASGYKGNFENDIRLLVYHNYKSEPDDSLKEAIETLRRFPNIAIVEERVPEFHSVACAKKTASDILQIGLPVRMDFPIIMMDADVKGLSAGTIDAALKALKNKLAASPGYLYDPAACAKFPVLRFVWQVAEAMRQKKLNLDANTMKSTIGPFTCTTRKSLALVGGYKPVLIHGGKPQSTVAYEDIRYSKDLSKATAVDATFKSLHPVADLGAAHFHVFLDAAREIEALIRGKRYDDRWMVSKYYSEACGSKRFDWHRIDTADPEIASVPELSSATPANMEKAMANFIRAQIMQTLE